RELILARLSHESVPLDAVLIDKICRQCLALLGRYGRFPILEGSAYGSSSTCSQVATVLPHLALPVGLTPGEKFVLPGAPIPLRSSSIYRRLHAIGGRARFAVQT